MGKTNAATKTNGTKATKTRKPNLAVVPAADDPEKAARERWLKLLDKAAKEGRLDLDLVGDAMRAGPDPFDRLAGCSRVILGSMASGRCPLFALHEGLTMAIDCLTDQSCGDDDGKVDGVRDFIIACQAAAGQVRWLSDVDLLDTRSGHGWRL